jgi:hypothetical protein
MRRLILIAATAVVVGASMLSTSASAFPGLPGPPGGGLPPLGGGFPGGLPHFPGGGPAGPGPLGGGPLGHGPLSGGPLGRGAFAGALPGRALPGGGRGFAAGHFSPRFAGVARGVGSGSGNSFRGNVYNGRYAGYGRGRYAAGAYAAGAYAAAAYGSASSDGSYGSSDGGCYYKKRIYQTSTGWRTRRVYVCS